MENKEKLKDKQNDKSNNSNTDNLTEKTINNASNVDLDVSPDNSHYDVTICEKT